MPDVVEDDPLIPDTARLWRRIAPWQWVSDDAAAGGFRPSSSIFDDPELSVVLVDECSLEILLAGHEGFGVAEFTAGEVRERGWGLVRAPDDKLPGHCHVLGKKRRTLNGKFAKTCRVVRAPAV